MPILCGTDLSAASVAALDVACALATMRGEGEVILLHVANIGDDDASREAQLADRRPGLRFVALKTRHGVPDDLPRPKVTPQEVAGRIRKLLADDGASASASSSSSSGAASV